MNWIKGFFRREPAINRLPRRGGTIDDELEAYEAGRGDGIPGIYARRRNPLDGIGPGVSRLEVMNFNLDYFVKQLVVPNALHFSVYLEAPIALLRLAAPTGEDEDIKMAIQARRTRLLVNVHPMPTYPMLQFVLAVFDQPTNPFKIESIRDITQASVCGFISRLLDKGWFNLHVYDEHGETCFFQTQIAVKDKDKMQISTNVNKAAELWLRIPAAQRDFDEAYQEFVRQHSVEELNIPPA
jgi:hypothetical protein